MNLRILAIETSCDDTGIAVIAAEPRAENLEPRHGQEHEGGRTVHVLANQLSSQTVHAQYGGVFPTVAKREHAQMLVPLLQAALQEVERYRMKDIRLKTSDTAATNTAQDLTTEQHAYLGALLNREPELLAALIPFLESTPKPDIGAIAVTMGPGLEPCLWVGINCAKALSYVWGVPVVGVNHMEGHIYAARVQYQVDSTKFTDSNKNQGASGSPVNCKLSTVNFPLLSLLISGGHTELVLSTQEGAYTVIGQTRDDAVGECFDKCARMLGLPYPGGPKIGLLAAAARAEGLPRTVVLPRPMKDSGDLDFSFSGLKTAVKVALEKYKGPTSTDSATRVDSLSEETQKLFAREIEDAITDVLLAKTRAALEQTQAATLVVSGGVSASTHIRAELEALVARDVPGVTLLFSPKHLATDNALMIALASIAHVERRDYVDHDALVARGNLRLG